MWEFLKAVALDNKKYYNHEISAVHNLFFPVEDSYSHFLKIKILKYLYNRLKKFGYTEKFVSTNQVIDIFATAGYKLTVIVKELDELLRYRFIETDDNVADKEFDTHLKDNQNISISLKGNYYVNNLIYSFVYIELIVQDTPIFDAEYYSKIWKLFPQPNEQGKQSLKGRLDTVMAFIEYLKYQEKKETIDSQDIIQDVMRELLNNGLQNGIEKVKKRIT